MIFTKPVATKAVGDLQKTNFNYYMSGIRGSELSCKYVISFKGKLSLDIQSVILLPYIYYRCYKRITSEFVKE